MRLPLGEIGQGQPGGGAAPNLAARYAPLRVLSAGPDGTAMLAQVQGSAAPVELRYVTIAETDPARFARIDAAAARYALIDHAGFRRLLERGVDEGTPVMVFEAWAGSDLGARLALGPLSPLDACELVEQLAQALRAAHRVGFVHGRIGPSAVLVDEAGAPRLDFSWLELGAKASALDAACQPPERGHEALDPSSDVCALAQLLRVLVLGRAPAPGDSCGALDALISAMTEPEREARPQWDTIEGALRAQRVELLRADAASLRPRATVQVKTTPGAGPALPPVHGHTLPLHAAATLASSADAKVAAGAPAAPVPSRLAPGMQLGRFELLHKIGEGGMGEVYRARDRTSGLAAAVKVLRGDHGDDPTLARRFRKEARILAQIKSPYVAELIELNRDGGVEFLALEFVEGQDLADLLAGRGGRLPEREALAIVADVCRGLHEAHARGIVHRDIKPENVLMARVEPAFGGGIAHQVKLCDFGIARALDQREGTLGFTLEGNLIGTPAFMAPEQANSQTLSPATDVYALGATLFLLISGRTPFEQEEVMAQLYAHSMVPPPELTVLCPEVSAATGALVARMLAKKPVDRFIDAAAALEAIERILGGEPTRIEAHPRRPSAAPERVVQHVFEWELRASPEALWPLVSNTDRLNRAVGLPPAAFERLAQASGVETYGANRVAGVDLRWREQPFEWIEGRRWGVLRLFERGVMRWFTIELELFPLPGGGTRLRYSMTLEPRHVFGRMIVALEMNGRQRAALGKAFARIDAYACASRTPAPGSDPFELPEPLGDAQRAALEQHVLQLRGEGVADDVLNALAAFCEHAPAQAVARLRPLAFARTYGLDPDALVEGCLRAARSGLLRLAWDVLCPLCRVPSDFVDSLQALKDHGRCPSCSVDFPLDFAQSLELVFRVSPEIRASELRTFCVGGPAFAPHVVAQVRLAPGERMELALELGSGAYGVRSPQLPQTFALHVSPSGRSARTALRFAGGMPAETEPRLLAPGALALALDNQLEREIVVRVERTAPREDALTAARAACLASFRKLFPGEVLASGRLVAVGRTAFVAARVHEQRKLLDALGDARAFECVLALIALLEQLASEEGGAVVKTASGSTLCAFGSSAAALRAALALRARLAQPDTGQALRALDVRIALHEGAAVAATFDGRLDYFGQSVESVLEWAEHAPPERVLLSPALARDPNTVAALERDGHTLAAPPPAASAALGMCMLVQPRAAED